MRMATRDVTPATLALADLFRRHRESALDGMTKLEAGQTCGFKGDSTYRNIEAGREVSLSSYRQAARKLGLPGGPERVEAIFSGQPDPGPGLAVTEPVAFHPSVDAERAQFLEVLRRLTDEVAANREALVHLAGRVSLLEQEAHPGAASRRDRKSAR